jgi:hypothetical protein
MYTRLHFPVDTAKKKKKSGKSIPVTGCGGP